MARREGRVTFLRVGGVEALRGEWEECRFGVVGVVDGRRAGWLWRRVVLRHRVVCVGPAEAAARLRRLCAVARVRARDMFAYFVFTRQYVLTLVGDVRFHRGRRGKVVIDLFVVWNVCVDEEAMTDPRKSCRGGRIGQALSRLTTVRKRASISIRLGDSVRTYVCTHCDHRAAW